MLSRGLHTATNAKPVRNIRIPLPPQPEQAQIFIGTGAPSDSNTGIAANQLYIDGSTGTNYYKNGNVSNWTQVP